MAVLQQTIPSTEQLLAMIQKLQADNAALAAKADATTKIRYKVSAEKGALSVYGLHSRFPVTLYVQQWERLLRDLPAMQAFIKANEASLTRKA